MAPVEQAATGSSRKSYVPVPLDLFTAGRTLDFSLYGRSAGGLALLCRAGDEVTAAALAAWQQAGRSVLYVDTAEHRLYQKFAESAFNDILGRPDLSPHRKADLCYKTTLELIRGAVDTSSPEQIFGQRRESWATNLVTLIYDDASAVEGLVTMLSHDYYTYTHMVNVSTMVTLLAYHLGERDRQRLHILAGGGLLHDMGKLRVNPDTLNKVGTLTATEWAELKSHPDLGLNFLYGRPDIDPIELLMVHQHHEKLDGSGYPLGLCGAEISIEAQMTAVVDIYDALTCKRPYRPPLSHEKTVGILRQDAEKKLNADMVRLWTEVMNRVVSREK